MYGIQRRYKRAYGGREAFVENIAAYVVAPAPEKVVMKEAYGQLGLMPPLPLPDDMLRKIAAYVYEESFPPPCVHWKHAISRAAAAGVPAERQRERQNYQRLCTAKGS